MALAAGAPAVAAAIVAALAPLAVSITPVTPIEIWTIVVQQIYDGIVANATVISDVSTPFTAPPGGGLVTGTGLVD